MGRLLAAVAAALAVYLCSILVPVTSEARIYPAVLDSDGGSTARLTWSRNNVYGTPVPLYPWRPSVAVAAGAELVELLEPGPATGRRARLELGLRPKPGASGRVVLLLDDGWREYRLRLAVTPRPEGDGDRDGIPNALELFDQADRRAFRAWFTAVAAAQFDELESAWQPVQRDCAGLVRYALVQALRRHDNAWRRAHPRLARLNLPDVRKYSYPRLPLVGDRPFRVRPGDYRPGEAERAFAAAASGRTLWEFNTVKVAGGMSRALAGDLLVFEDRERQPLPRHLMILLDDGRVGDAARVVYHTGPDANSPGEVRLVTVGALAEHADDAWHPRPYNPHFQGVYRLKILEGGRS